MFQNLSDACFISVILKDLRMQSSESISQISLPRNYHWVKTCNKYNKRKHKSRKNFSILLSCFHIMPNSRCMAVATIGNKIVEILSLNGVCFGKLFRPLPHPATKVRVMKVWL